MKIYSLNTKDFKLSILLFFTIIIILLHQSGLLYNFSYFFKIPLGYQGDGLFAFSMVKTYSENFPFFEYPRLNYPFGTNASNGYLVSDKFLMIFWAIYCKFFGIYPSTTLMQISSHVLSGLGMFFASRLIGINKNYSFLAGLSLGLHHFIFVRGLAHLTVGFVFIVPFIIIVIANLSTEIESNWNSKYSKLIHYFTFVLTSMSFIYYYYILIIFSLLLLLFLFLKKDFYKFFYIIKLLAISGIVFIFFNLDFFYFLIGGSDVPGRNIASYELYSLKLPELFFPSGYHKISLIPLLGHYLYQSKSILLGEYWSPYLGINGIVMLIFFIFYNFYYFSRKNKFYLSSLNFQVVVILLFSMVGGVGLILAILGLNPARAMNRYSILIFIIVTFFFFFYLSNLKNIKNYLKILLSMIFVIFIYLDLPRPADVNYLRGIETAIESDKKLIKELESKMQSPKIAILPHMVFPENGPINSMLDYEPMRLYLNSKNAYFSYGRNKYSKISDGIPLDQGDIKEKIQLSKNFGYDFILLNKKGYKPNELSKDLTFLKNNFSEIKNTHPDYYSFDLNQSLNENLIFRKDVFFYSSGWSQQEPTWRWATENKASLTIFGNTNNENLLINFKLQSFGTKNRNYKIFFNDNIINEGIINNQKLPISLKINKLKKINKLVIEVDGKKYRAGYGDNRKITFSIHDFLIK